MSKKLNYSKAVVILSGGADSATLLYKMKDEFKEVKAISFDYGQKHRKELVCARLLCHYAKIDHRVVDLSCLKEILSGSSLTGKARIPKGHYAAENMKSTVVPNRNSIMLNIAMGYAISLNFGTVGYGAHSGDHAIYPDCRPSFLEAICKLAKEVHFEELAIYAPFINMTKTDVFLKGMDLAVPYQHTWSCYEGKERPCLKCGTCQERTISFRDAGYIDPALSSKEWASALKIVKGIK